MVWMHGGGFTNGSSMESYAYDGRTLSEFGDVVVVSVNHRLNILGTLDLSAYGPQYANSRYTGTADLVVALQWVHDNIERFGGDPGNVMIFGQSGGGGKVVRMMHMPAAKGLFHKVAAQSGGNNTYRTTDAGREHQGAADDRGPHAQEPEPHGRPDRQAEDGALLGPDYRRDRRAAIGGAGGRQAHAQLGSHRRRPVRDARVLRLGRHDSAHGRRGVQRDAGHAHARRRPQERMDREGRSTTS